MFQTVRTINEMTSIVTDGYAEYVAKKIFPEDIEIYEKLARIPPDTPSIAKIRGVFSVDDSLCAACQLRFANSFCMCRTLRGDLI